MRKTALALSIALSCMLLATAIPQSIQVSAARDEEPDAQAAQSSGAVSAASAGALSGDFNGDGEEDLAIGVPDDDIGGFTNSGGVNVIYGGSPGLQTASPVDQQWSQCPLDVAEACETSDRFGYSLAVGDFNGDGRDDLAIGVPFEDIPTPPVIADAGGVNVLYGSASGLTSTGNQFWSQDSTNVENTSEPNDHFGLTLAAGDFNNDGRDDLAIGVPDEDTAATNDGAVNVLYGGSSGLQTTSPADQFTYQGTSGVENDPEAGDLFGFSLAAGDFNGDLEDDLSIGVPFEDTAATNDGAVNTLYGGASGLQTTSPVDQFLYQDTTGVEETAAANDHFGWSLATGNFNGDIRDDLAIGVPDEDVSGDSIFDGGLVNVLYGGSSGLQTSSPLDQIFWQNGPDVEETSAASDRFGFSVAAGDFNSDGEDDLAIGVPNEDVSGDTISNGGLVNVIYGSSSSGLSATAAVPDQIFYQNGPDVEETSAANDQFGFSVAAGDYNGDGQDDLAIAVPFEDTGSSNEVTDAGLVNVIYGSLSGLSATAVEPDQIWWQDKANVEGTSAANDHFGLSVG